MSNKYSKRDCILRGCSSTGLDLHSVLNFDGIRFEEVWKYTGLTKIGSNRYKSKIKVKKNHNFICKIVLNLFDNKTKKRDN